MSKEERHVASKLHTLLQHGGVASFVSVGA